MNLRLFHRIAAPIAALFRRDRLDHDLADEMSAHLDLAIEENLRNGLSPQQARRQALIQFGGTQQAKETHREARSLPFLETAFHDARFALRLLKKSPSFTIVAILTLALGIGATTAIFSVVYGVLLRSLPYHNPQQIVRLWEQDSLGGRMNLTDPNFVDLRAQNHSLAGLAEFNSDTITVTGRGEPSRVQYAFVSRDFFSVMGVQPVLGRTFLPEEQRLNAPTAALVSYAYWQQTLGSTRDLSSVHLKIGNQPASVVGVLPPGFHFPDNSELWIPRERDVFVPSRNAHNWNGIARLRDDSSLAAARTELSGIAQRLKQQYGEDTVTVAVALQPLREAMTGDVRPALFILLGASAFLLLIACANVTNLLLAQSSGRERELAVRSALGAPRSRLIRQFLTESFLLSLFGGVLGILLAYAGLRVLVALAPANLPRLEDISLNSTVLLFSLAAISLVSMALAVFTGLRSISNVSKDGLQEGSRGDTGTVKKQRMGRSLAAVQLATALVLLVGASLMGRSLLRVLSINSGFRTDRVATMEFGLPDLPTSERIAFLDALLAQIRQIPGVDAVGGTNVLPLSGRGFSDTGYVSMNPEQLSPAMQDLFRRSAGDLRADPKLLPDIVAFFNNIFHDKSQVNGADYVVASPDYFRTLSIPLIRGRFFDDRDTFDSPNVALISQSVADEKWPNQDPIGRTVENGGVDGDLRLLTVIGVVADVRDHNLESLPFPTFYVDYRQRPRAISHFTVVMHTTGDPEPVFSAARSILHNLNPDLPPRFRAFSEVYSASLAARRFSLTLVGVFSFAALLLALAGIYGVISYSVSQRTREIGVRMALGATTREVLLMVLKQGALTGAIGIAAGLAGSFAITRLLRSQLFEISPTDPLTLAGVSLLLLVISLAACAIPGRRATQIDPVVALRCE